MDKRSLELYEFGGLNDNKKITATFAHYAVNKRCDTMYISAILSEGELPRINEGYRVNGHRLWAALCRLHDRMLDKSDEEICDIIVDWCKKNVHPYYFYGDPYNTLDASQKTDQPFWDFYVNCLEVFEFSLERFKVDIRNLYDTTQLMVAFHSLTHDLEIAPETVKYAEKVLGRERFFLKSKQEQLLVIKRYISNNIPKFPMELTVTADGSFVIVPTLESIFDVAYYAMAQYVSASPDYPIHWGGRTGIAYCLACGNIFIKNGNRQKYCDNPECKLERERRKSKDYYYRKIQREKDEEWA